MEVTFDGENFTMKALLDSNVSVKEMWGVKTNQFVPVTVVMYSPNYWDEQEGIGNRHYFFMLKDCIIFNNEKKRCASQGKRGERESDKGEVLVISEVGIKYCAVSTIPRKGLCGRHRIERGFIMVLV